MSSAFLGSALLLLDFHATQRYTFGIVSTGGSTHMTVKKRILVVDDEDALRIVLGTQLKGHGYSVSSAADGDIAIQMLGFEYFDLILLDLKMPNVDGYEVLKYVKIKHPATKVIILTGFADLKNALDTKGLGADMFLGKPYELSDLLTAIHRLLGDA
jgi:CheY-like chemotaxis protein